MFSVVNNTKYYYIKFNLGSDIRTYIGKILRVFILLLIFMLALYQLPAAHEKECSITKSNTECGNCCCCGDEEECCCEPENQPQNDDDISCICKINEAEPVEEQKEPVNLNLNFQKLITILKSDFLSNIVDIDNSVSSNFITVKNIPSSNKLEIYLIISNLRI